VTTEPADRRSVHTDALATLGTVIDEHQKRDAIHLAVIPAVASCTLSPGEWVRVANGEASLAEKNEAHGIVDPFLPGAVLTGEHCWVVIKPRVITSLRHVWTHPDIPDDGQVGNDAIKESEAWLREYADRVNSHYGGEEAYQTLMDDIKGKGITYHGRDMHSREELVDADELRHHASIVLGYAVNWDDFSYFSCTC